MVSISPLRRFRVRFSTSGNELLMHHTKMFLGAFYVKLSWPLRSTTTNTQNYLNQNGDRHRFNRPAIYLLCTFCPFYYILLSKFSGKLCSKNVPSQAPNFWTINQSQSINQNFMESSNIEITSTEDFTCFVMC